jgi:hypothetical protein
VLLLITAPFLGQAHKIDDPLYLLAARQVLAEPLDPLGAPSYWHERPATLFDDLYNPPLIAYLLALPVAFDGGGELSVHLLMLAIAAAAMLACAAAGEAWGVPARYALLLAASPALAASTVSAMTDVPFLLLSVLAWRSAAVGEGLRSGLLTGLSALTKYVGLVNLPLALLALRPRGALRLVSAGAAAALVFGGYCIWNLWTYGALHVLAASRFQALSVERQADLIVSFVAALGLVGMPGALPLLRWSRGTGFAAACGAAAGLVVTGGRSGSWIVVSLGLAGGCALLAAAVGASRRVAGRDPFLPAAFWSFTLYTCLFVYFGTARYLLPLLPPLLWLLVRGEAVRQVSRVRWLASVGASAVLSVLVLWGDAGEAGAWRNAALELPAASRGLHTGRWGFAWYAERRGYRALAPREALRDGDVVAVPDGIHAPEASPAQRALLAPLSTIEVAAPRLRLTDSKAGAGFYSSAWGLAPLGWRAGATARVSLLAPDVALMAALRERVTGPVVVDLGSEEAGHVLLDGWSRPESFDDGVRRTFVWAMGPDSALRLPLPQGVRRLTIRASPHPSALGVLRIEIGAARAVVSLRPGWQAYEAALVGEVAGGMTDVVLRPAGCARPVLLSRERRPLSVAVDSIAFGDAAGTENRGFWAVRSSDGRPALFVAGEGVRVVTRAP